MYKEQDIIRLIRLLSGARLPLTDEKQTQIRIAEIMDNHGLNYSREYHLDSKNIPDFFNDVLGIAIEVKIKGNSKDIYKQCERYASFEQVKAIVLVTNRMMGLPKSINGKACYMFNIGKAWL